MVETRDYVGIVSLKDEPRKLEKAKLTVVKSDKVNAPLFKEYPLTIECELESIDGEMGTGATVVGNIINVSADEAVMTDGKIDAEKLDPITYDPQAHTYRKLGAVVASAFSDGKKLF